MFKENKIPEFGNPFLASGSSRSKRPANIALICAVVPSPTIVCP